eukprot:13026-Heterococcus_DN1.PRE.5
MVLVVTLFLFNIYCGFSGTPVFEDNMIAAFNFFLGLPIIAVGVFDQDVTRKYALKHPEVLLETRTITYCTKGPCCTRKKKSTVNTTTVNTTTAVDSDGNATATVPLNDTNHNGGTNATAAGTTTNSRQQTCQSAFGWTVGIWVFSILFYFAGAGIYNQMPSLAWEYYGGATTAFKYVNFCK